MVRQKLKRRRMSEDMQPQSKHEQRAGILAMPGYTTFQQRSVATGLVYDIFVHVPDAEAPASGFPVVYVLDANSDFIVVAETVKRASRKASATGISPSIVVGIGYPDTQAYNLDRRQFDLTRCPPDESALPDQPNGAHGGQAAFVAFIRDQLQSHIQQNYHADPARRILLGHSLAGYFVLDLLTQYPGMFAGYICFSPSIWWDRAGLSQSVGSLGSIQKALRIYMGVGQWEQEVAPWQAAENFSDRYHLVRQRRRMIDNAREMAGQIGAVLDDRSKIKFEVGDDEDHATVVTALLCRALRFVGGV
jgi:predicted alpha/beta superfamily hydrolase